MKTRYLLIVNYIKDGVAHDLSHSGIIMPSDTSTLTCKILAKIKMIPSLYILSGQGARDIRI